jgi:hypothetical protein
VRAARLSVRNLDEHVGVARFVQRAIAREVSPSELLPDLVDRDVESSGEQVAAVAADRFRSAEIERVRIAPLRWPSDDHCTRGQARALPARSLQTLRHPTMSQMLNRR